MSAREEDEVKTSREIPPPHVIYIRRVTIPLLFFFWGIGVAGFQLFPYQLIAEPLEELKAWWRGSPEGAQLDLSEKLKSILIDPDLPISGSSELHKRFKLRLRPVRDPQGLLEGSTRTLYYYSFFARGYYVLFFQPYMPDARYGAVVMSGSGEVKRLIKRPIIKGAKRVLGQGGVTDDGKLIFNTYFALHVTNICGDVLLDLPKGPGLEFSQGEGVGFHHKASGEGDVIWTWYGNSIRRYDLKTKQITREISLLDIVANNPERALFEARLVKSNTPGSVGQWKYSDLKNGLTLDKISRYDPFHQNDVDMLTAERAHLFPQFNVGDLLLSFRSINLVVVIDPETLKVKWHHYGDFSRQHDPDWGSNGEIVVYDNRSHQQHSRIISIDPDTHAVTTLVDGERWGFYQFAQGNQQLSADGRVLLTNESEAAHIGPKRVEFYFKYENRHHRALDVGTAYFVEPEQYEAWVAECAKQ